MQQHGFALVDFSFSVVEGSCTENKKTPKLLNEHYVPMALLAKNAPLLFYSKRDTLTKPEMS